jgi:hypothetical protein
MPELKDISKIPFENRYGIIEKPSALLWTNIPFKVIRDRSKSVRTTFDPKKYDVSRSVTRYVNGDSGNDASDGLTESTAWKTIEYALATLNTLNPTSAEIILLSRSGYNNGFGNKTVTYPLTIKSKNGIANVAFSYGKQFSVYSGNVYRKSGSGTTSAIDTKYCDTYGAPLALAIVTSIQEVTDTANSCYNDGSYLYIHLVDSRVPDDFVFGRNNSYIFNAKSNLYLENINIYTGYYSVYSTATTAVTHVYNSCGFYGSESNGVSFNPSSVGSSLYMVKCKTMLSKKDGNNVHGQSLHLEDNCLVIGCGGGGDNNNASTVHDGTMSVRVGCTYISGLNTARTVHDIGSSVSWLIGCYADCGLKVGDTLGNPAYVVGDSQMYLDDCYAKGSGYWFRVDGTGHMYFKTCIPVSGLKYSEERNECILMKILQLDKPISIAVNVVSL